MGRRGSLTRATAVSLEWVMQTPLDWGARSADATSSLGSARCLPALQGPKRVLNYPAHLAGAALFGLRCAIGLTLVAESWHAMPPPLADVAGASAHVALVLCGLALALGFLSPLCSVVVALSHALVVVRAIVGATSPDVFGPAFVGVAAALTIAAVGPGAFSVDARLFGRHRIVIRSRRDRA